MSLDIVDRIGFCVVDRFQDAEHGLIGAAVQRAFQGADRRGDRRVHVGKRRRDDPRSESGSIEFVIGMQDQRDIESALGSRRRRSCHSACSRKFAACDSERSGSTTVLPFADAIIGGHNHGDLGSQPDGFVDVGVVIVVSSSRDRRRTARKPRCAARPWAERDGARCAADR